MGYSIVYTGYKIIMMIIKFDNQSCTPYMGGNEFVES